MLISLAVTPISPQARLSTSICFLPRWTKREQQSQREKTKIPFESSPIFSDSIINKKNEPKLEKKSVFLDELGHKEINLEEICKIYLENIFSAEDIKKLNELQKQDQWVNNIHPLVKFFVVIFRLQNYRPPVSNRDTPRKIKS